MKKKFPVMVVVLLFAAASFGQAELEKYVGQYQVTGAPIMITVTATGGKLSIQATGQGMAEIELVSGEDYSVKGTAITLTFLKDATGKVTGMTIHQAPGFGCSGSEDQLVVRRAERQVAAQVCVRHGERHQDELSRLGRDRGCRDSARRPRQ
jgi:hypothetical protein